MRCLSCNKNLTDKEATRKYEDGTYVDLCVRCLAHVPITTIENESASDIEFEDMQDDPVDEVEEDDFNSR